MRAVVMTGCRKDRSVPKSGNIESRLFQPGSSKRSRALIRSDASGSEKPKRRAETDDLRSRTNGPLSLTEAALGPTVEGNVNIPLILF